MLSKEIIITKIIQTNNKKLIIKQIIKNIKNKINANAYKKNNNVEQNTVNEIQKKLNLKSLKNSNTNKENKKNKIRKNKNMIKKQLLSIIEEFQKSGISYIEGLNESQIFQIVSQARKAYYNNKPIMSDNEFDIIWNITKKYPNNEALDEVGAPIEKKDKVELPYFMGSMDKSNLQLTH